MFLNKETFVCFEFVQPLSSSLSESMWFGKLAQLIVATNLMPEILWKCNCGLPLSASVSQPLRLPPRCRFSHVTSRLVSEVSRVRPSTEKRAGGSLNLKTTKRFINILFFPVSNAFSCHRPIFQSWMAPYVTLSSQILFNCVATYLLSAKCGNHCCLCLLFANNTFTAKLLFPLDEKALCDIAVDWVLEQKQPEGVG